MAIKPEYVIYFIQNILIRLTQSTERKFRETGYLTHVVNSGLPPKNDNVNLNILVILTFTQGKL